VKSDRLDTLKKALNLAALSRARMARKTVTSKSPVTESRAPASGQPRTAPILIDDIPEFEIHLKVSVGPGRKPRTLTGETTRLRGPRTTDALKPALDPKLEEFFQDLEPKLLKWLADNRKNATHFLVDPVGALIASGLVKDPERIARLRALRPKAPPPEKVPRCFQISHVAIDVDET